MDTYRNYHTESAVPVRKRRRRRRRCRGIVPVITLSVILAVLTGLAVRISVFGKIANVDSVLDPSTGMTPILKLPETVELKPLTLPSGAEVQPQELVSGLEGTGINVSFAKEPATEVVGLQKVELLFALDGAECTRTVSLTRFQMVDQISTMLGSEDVPDIRNFVPNRDINASFKGTSPADIPEESCGIHSLVIECDGREYPVTYLVTEDIPPEAVGQSVTAEAGSVPAPETLVDQIVDHSEVTVAYAQMPELTVLGVHEIELVLTDAFGNSSQVIATIEVIPAENGPRFTGLEELHIQVGSTISYKAGVSAADPQDGEVTFTVDPGNVDNKTVGTYTAYYTATDADGNSLTVPRTIVVQDEITAAVEQKAQAVLDKIITKNMTRDEKIYKVYYYSRHNVLFVGSSDKRSIEHAAYEGFTTGRGDCYTYYAMNVIMLDLLGIENLEVARVGGTSNHWWNLVLFEDGKYYHVDSCPKSIYLDGQNYSKLTDSDLDEYTNNKQVAAHRPHYYTYDKTLPEYQDIEIAP